MPAPEYVHDRSPPNLHWHTPLPSFTSYNQPSNRAPPGLAPGYLDTSRGLLLKRVVSMVSPNRLGHVIRDLTLPNRLSHVIRDLILFQSSHVKVVKYVI